MGYDIESVGPDRNKAMEFAKKYQYDYLFDESTKAYMGSDRVYFRANIWGMAMIRRVLDSVVNLNNSKYPEEFAMATMDNSGNVCSVVGIKEYLTEIVVHTGLYPESFENSDVFFNELREALKPVMTQYVRDQRREDALNKINNNQPIANEVETEADEVNHDLNLVIEFLEFSDICLKLGGYQVF
jgi:hypothetical protein